MCYYPSMKVSQTDDKIDELLTMGVDKFYPSGRKFGFIKVSIRRGINCIWVTWLVCENIGSGKIWATKLFFLLVMALGKREIQPEKRKPEKNFLPVKNYGKMPKVILNKLKK